MLKGTLIEIYTSILGHLIDLLQTKTFDLFNLICADTPSMYAAKAVICRPV